MAAAVTIPNVIVDTSSLDAARPMANWNALRDWINTNAVHLDGSKAMTGTLSGPAGVDPVSDNEYSRKAYVDTKVSTVTSSLTGSITTAQNTANTALTNANAALALRGASATTTNPQSITGVGTGAFTFDVEQWDTGGFFTPSSNSIVIPTGEGGNYLVTATAIATGFGSSARMWIGLGGASYVSMVKDTNISGGNDTWHGCTMFRLSQGTAVQILIKNVSGSTNAYGTLTVQKISN